MKQFQIAALAALVALTSSILSTTSAKENAAKKDTSTRAFTIHQDQGGALLSANNIESAEKATLNNTDNGAVIALSKWNMVPQITAAAFTADARAPEHIMLC